MSHKKVHLFFVTIMDLFAISVGSQDAKLIGGDRDIRKAMSEEQPISKQTMIINGATVTSDVV